MKNISELSEHQEQCLVVLWCELNSSTDRRLSLIYAIPNGTWARNIGAARKAKAEGAKKGVPDLFLPVAANGCYGLYVEMKKTVGGSISVDQKHWLQQLEEQGYQCEVCKGSVAAISVIKRYLGLNM